MSDLGLPTAVPHAAAESECDEDFLPASGTSARDLRIALFCGNYNCVRDGANNALNHLVSYLLQEGAQVRVYSPTVPEPAFEPAGELVSVRSVALPGRSEYRLTLGLDERTKADVRRFAPTNIHVSAPDPQGYQAQQLARELGCPLVTSLHTRFETYFEYYGLRAFRPWAERYLRTFYARSDLVLVPNSQILEELRSWNMDNRIAVWSRGVDRQRFHPTFRNLEWRRSQGWDDADIVPLFFGRLVREKGIAEFSSMIAQANEAGLRVRPMIVGDGPAKVEFARQLPGGARFLGHLSGPDLSVAIASADVLINPSTTEAFGNVNLEAMAAGLAVISADVPSAQALISHNDNGVLVRPHDVAGYVDALGDLVHNARRRVQLGAAAAASAAAFTWSATLTEVVQNYLRLIG
ncbi:glycosyltransferase family 1 protein [Sphingomonas sp. G124]|uniref:Glycosyltransferase family 1 protein n=1 Tax=Sphingomonas cremea TaxID=2904799 RepID=A0A9X1QMA0_9SPHN|nr:glycosyltransferase family 1 protein [Sphingomonas cremea]MCF2515985.1 glycosyltransferase family 1 protein [Sphingomonas cremea]